MNTVDLNADLGEGFGVWRLGDDDAMLDIVTSANVACGFHAGDPSTMRRVCAAAAARGVAIGAQVGYRDLGGFGRRVIAYDPAELRDEILYQIAALAGFCQSAGTTLRYVKPHGALYNAAVTDPLQASAVVAAVQDFNPALPILTLPDSMLARAARTAGLRPIAEGFADRAYRPDGALIPRTEAGAVLHDPAGVAARAVRMARTREIVAVDGTVVPCPVDSICVHGDTPGAVALAAAVRHALAEAAIDLRPFQ